MTQWVCGAGLSVLVFLSTACSTASNDETNADEQPNAAQSVNDDNGDGWPLSNAHFDTLENTYRYTNTTTGARFSQMQGDLQQIDRPLVASGSFYPSVALRDVSVRVTEAMSDADWNIRTRKLGRFFRHLAECALDGQHTASLTVVDASGAGRPAYTKASVRGQYGLAPQWSDSPLGGDVGAQQRVSACMLARMNKFGVPVSISMRSPAMPTLASSASEVAAYPLFEGAFWGNIFSSSPSAFVCYNGDQQTIITIRNHAGRECAVGTCSQIQNVGACGMNNVCTSTSPGTGGFNLCRAYSVDNSNVVTVFLQQDSLASGEFTAKMALEDSSLACPAGSALAGISGYTSLHGAICRKSGIDIFPADSPRTTLTRGSSVHGAPRPVAAFVSTLNAIDSSEQWPNGDPSRFECAPGEYIAAISGSGGDIDSVTCAAGNMRGDVCRAVHFGDRAASAEPSGNWSDVNVRTECGLGEHVAGIYLSRSVFAQSRMLCCAD